MAKKHGLTTKIFSIFLFVVFPIAVGSFIYVAWGQRTLWVFNWFESFGLGAGVAYLRIITAPLKTHVPEFVIYNLPDGIWVFSVTALMLIIWEGRIKNNNWVWIFSGLFLGVTSEIGQHPRISLVPGTFDYWDILFYVVGFMLAFVLLKNN